jgi:hypothetical protein
MVEREVHVIVFRDTDTWENGREIRALSGFAIERPDDAASKGPWPLHWVPVARFKGSEQLFLTLGIAKELLGEPEGRAELADLVVEMLTDSLKKLIEQGPKGDQPATP